MTEPQKESCSEIPRMSEAKLRDFVLGYCDGRIYTNYDAHDEDIGRVFAVIGMGALSAFTKEAIAQIGCIWEELDKAGPRVMNGRPMFFSCHLMHRDDFEIVRKAVADENDRRQNIKIKSE